MTLPALILEVRAMPNDPSRPSSWKGEERSALPPGHKSSSGSQYAWKPGAARATSPSNRIRKIKVTFLTFMGAGFLGLMVWLVYLLFPPRPTCVTVVAADFRPGLENLAIPLNIYGDRGARDFLNWASSGDRAARQWCSVLGDRNAPWPADTGRREDDWLKALADRKEDNVVIYLAQPGAADEAGNAFLFNEKGDKIYISKILERLKPIKKKKLLLLDCTHTPTDWRHGFLVNDFATGVQKLEKEIGEDSSLLVICASGPGQRSWVSEEFGQSVFTHFLIDGLSGSAAPGDRDTIYASDLIAYVFAKVDDWVQRNRADEKRPFGQQPLLLPAKADSTERATKFLLAYRDRSQEPAGKPSKRPLKEPELASAWARCDELANRDPKPWVYTPRLWRRYRELLMRYETLLRAGEDESAAKLRGAIDTVAGKIDSARKVDATEAISAGLSMPAALGCDAFVDDVNLARLAERPLDQLDALAVELKALAPGADEAVPRLKFINQVLKNIRANPAKLADGVSRINRIDNGGASRPAEAHLAVMIENYSAMPGWTKPSPELIQLAFDTRRLAEEAALSVGLGEGHPYSERLPSGLVAELLQADRDRRQGEDHLFCSQRNQSEAEKKLTAAKVQYESIRKAAAPIRRSLEIRDEVFANLPYLTDWVALARPKDIPTDDHVRRLESLWKEAHALADRLARLDPLDESAPPPRSLLDAPKDNPNGKPLLEQAEDVNKEYAALLKSYRDYALPLAQSDATGLQTTRQELEYALSVPGPIISALDRIKLVARSRDNSAKLALGDQLATPGEAVKEADLARYQGRLARAMLGERIVNELSDSGLAKMTDLSDDAAPRLGSQLGGHFRKLTTESNRQNRDDPAKTPVPLPWRERLGMLAGTATEPSREPALQARDARWKNAFLRMAHRAEIDHWYDEKQQPFSEKIAKKFLKGLPESESLAEAGKVEQRRDHGKLKVEPVEKEHILTTQKDVASRFAVQGIEAYFEPGFATFAAKLDRAVELAVKSGSEPHPVSLAKTTEEVVPLVAVQPLDALQQGSDVSLSMAAYYRGQVISGAVAKLPIRPTPDLTINRPPANFGAQIAARADPDLDLGTIAIVFDCSGSMKEGTKLADAKNAIRAFQKSIPAGTRVMLYVYGHHPEQSRWEETGERLVFERSWDPQDTRKSEALYNAVANLTAEGYTPLLATMVKALDDKDFLDATGFKTLLVLTDGCDNISGRAPTTAHTEQIAQRFMEDVVNKKREVSLQMMLFQLKAEEAIANQQFPDAGFEAMGRQSRKWTVENASELIEKLGESVRPRFEIFRNNVKMPFELLAKRPGEPFDWAPAPPLQEFGEYEVRVRGLSQKIHLEDGDKLALRLRKVTVGNRVVRQIMADEPERSGIKKLDGLTPDSPFVMGQLMKPDGSGSTMRTRVTLEDQMATREERGILRLDRPRFVWWEFRAAGQKQVPPRSRVTSLFGQPTPTWELASDAWPSLNGNRLPSTIEVWCSASEPIACDDVTMSAGETIVERPLDGKAAVLESVGYESFSIPTNSTGGNKLERCLVFRIRSPQGRKYVPVLTTSESVPEVHRYYLLSNCSTSAFLLSGNAQTRPVRFKIVCIDDAKERAVRLSRDFTNN